ncbi:vacuolar protein sorting-associated protein VTA1 homolog [Artemia franciscana]|uniref:Vacuolar protein sorting-associated protein VTA1 homolog n=1 Tax=Artemia franciscana TaxID=6661 RepID=A0AA88HWF8_ARTSF|nr:hypothetical protein QYM36_010068 [Artemia franciscana]
MVMFPNLNLPPSLKPLQHYLKAATEQETRDPVIAYWCRLFALQLGMKLDKKSKEASAVLLPIMDWLEKARTEMHENEAVTNDLVAKAHLENHAMKLFTWADTEDRAAHFNKNVVKAFYTSGIVMDVLETFGEVGLDISEKRRYAKWKATYLHNCLKNGETPIAGPPTDELELFSEPQGNAYGGETKDYQTPFAPDQGRTGWPSVPEMNQTPTPAERRQPVTPAYEPQAVIPPYVPVQPSPSMHQTPDPEIIKKVEKYCRFTMSALNYDDVPEAIKNLELALRLLKTGQ